MGYWCHGLGMRIKAKCEGVHVIIMGVVLCPNCICASKKNNEHIMVKSTCVEKKKNRRKKYIEDNKL